MTKKDFEAIAGAIAVATDIRFAAIRRQGGEITKKDFEAIAGAIAAVTDIRFAAIRRQGGEMTKKDFEAIAGAIAAVTDIRFESRPTAEQQAISDALGRVRENIADVLAASNPRFDRARFIAACEGE